MVGFYLPPLREQPEVIPALAQKFLADFAAHNARPVRGIVPKALDALVRYDWPGNIRELRNVIERAVALCPTTAILCDDLPDYLCAGEPRLFSKRTLALAQVPARVTLDAVRQDAELARLREALQNNNNNRRRAAAELGISRMTLYKKLRKYGLMTVNDGVLPETSHGSISADVG